MVAPTIDELMSHFAQNGQVEWIGIRPERREPLVVVNKVKAIAGKGLEGDHSTNKKKVSKRQVTLIMIEHLAATASILGVQAIDPNLLRRNIVVSGINLQSLKGKRFRIGTAELELSSECHPCSRMEENLGNGGYNAMRGHGGWCAVVLKDGEIKPGDEIAVIAETSGQPG